MKEVGETSTKKNKRIWIRTISLVLFLLSVFLIIFFRKWLFINPFKPYPVESIGYISKNDKNDLIISCKCGKEILKVSSDGELTDKLISGSNSFENSTFAVEGNDGNIYVYEIMYNKGVRISSERMLKLDANGKLEAVIDEKLDNVDAMRSGIVDVEPARYSVRYIKCAPNQIEIHEGNGTVVDTFPFQIPVNIVNSASYDDSTGILYYSTYYGKVYELLYDGTSTLIYDSDDYENSVPVDVCLDSDHIYISDVGIGDVICIDKASGETTRMPLPKGADEIGLMEALSCDGGGLVAASEETIVQWDNGEPEILSEIRLSTENKVKTAALWVAVIYVICIIIFKLIVVAYRIKNNADTSTIIAISIVGGVILLGVLFLGTLFPSFEDQYISEIYAKEEMAASALSNNLSVVDFMKLDKPSDFMSDPYKKIRSEARSLFFSGKCDDLYCEVYRIYGDKISIVYTLEDIYSGYPSSLTVHEMDKVIKNGRFMRLSDDTSQGSYLYVMAPLKDKNGNTVGIIEVGTDMTNINKKNDKILFDLIMNTIAVTVIVIMVIIELLYYVRGKKKYLDFCKEGKEKVQFPSEVYRFVVFLIYFFTNLTAAILPIYAIKISKSVNAFGLAPELLAAIPISAEVFSGAVTGVLGGKILKKIGIKRAVIISSILFSGSLFLRIIPNIWVLALSSLLLGAGWGIELLMVDILIARLPEEEKDLGYAYENTASLSGANVAIVFGGFLIQWISYKALFLFTAVISLTLVGVSIKYLSKLDYRDVKESSDEPKDKISLLRFLFTPRIITFFLFMLIPLLVSGYFLTYMFPILGERLGLSETYIGYSYILCGICALLFGNRMTEFFSVNNKKALGLFLSVILYSSAFLFVATYVSIPALIGALVLIGFADSFGIPLLSGYFTDIGEVEAYGYDRSLGIFNLVGNGAESLGSFFFGLILISGVSRGLIIMVACMLGLSILFMLTRGLKIRRKHVVGNE